MSLRFRRSVRLFPGVRLNLSKTGISTTIGGRGLALNVGSRGLYGTVGLPGSGLSIRQRLDGGGAPDGKVVPADQSQVPIPAPLTPVVLDMSAIASASSDAVTSPGLREFRALLESAFTERRQLNAERPSTQSAAEHLAAKAGRWERGWLFRRLFAARFRRLKEESAEATLAMQELLAAIEASRVSLEILPSAEVTSSFEDAMARFRELAACLRCWDTTAERRTDQRAERTSATTAVIRKPIALRAENCDLLRTDSPAMRWQNANGGDLYVYPGLLLVLRTLTDFAVVDLAEVCLEYTLVRFIESEALPGDSQVVEQTWEKVNKDGSPDRRFVHNRQLPVLGYGGIRFSSASGLNEEYLFSSAPRAEAFARAFCLHQTALRQASIPATKAGLVDSAGPAGPCASCGATPSPGARFCHACGKPVLST